MGLDQRNVARGRGARQAASGDVDDVRKSPRQNEQNRTLSIGSNCCHNWCFWPCSISTAQEVYSVLVRLDDHIAMAEISSTSSSNPISRSPALGFVISFFHIEMMILVHVKKQISFTCFLCISKGIFFTHLLIHEVRLYVSRTLQIYWDQQVIMARSRWLGEPYQRPLEFRNRLV